MLSKSILKKTTIGEAASVEDTQVDETNIILDADFKSIKQDGSGLPGTKKLQIKKKESISASKPTPKIIKKKVSITEEPEDFIIKDKHTTPTEKAAEKTVEKGAEKTIEKVAEKTTEKDNEVLVDVGKALKVSKKPSKKQDITEIFNDDDVDYRYIITNYDFSKNKTLPKITKYEKALLVGKRAKQIEEGANPNVKVLPGQTSIDIAEEELRQRKIPFIIKRPLGNKFEYWKPIDMEVIMD